MCAVLIIITLLGVVSGGRYTSPTYQFGNYRPPATLGPGYQVVEEIYPAEPDYDNSRQRENYNYYEPSRRRSPTYWNRSGNRVNNRDLRQNYQSDDNEKYDGGISGNNKYGRGTSTINPSRFDGESGTPLRISEFRDNSGNLNKPLIFIPNTRRTLGTERRRLVPFEDYGIPSSRPNSREGRIRAFDEHNLRNYQTVRSRPNSGDGRIQSFDEPNLRTYQAVGRKPGFGYETEQPGAAIRKTYTYFPETRLNRHDDETHRNKVLEDREPRIDLQYRGNVVGTKELAIPQRYSSIYHYGNSGQGGYNTGSYPFNNAETYERRPSGAYIETDYITIPRNYQPAYQYPNPNQAYIPTGHISLPRDYRPAYQYGNGGETFDRSTYNSGRKNLNDQTYKAVSEKLNSDSVRDENQFSQGKLALGNSASDKAYYVDEEGGRRNFEDGKVYHGGNYHNQEGTHEDTNKQKSSHKKGHKITGFKKSHHKDETQNSEEYYDEVHDEGDNIALNKKSSDFGENGATLAKEGQETQRYAANEDKKQGQYNSEHFLDRKSGDEGQYKRNKYIGSNRTFGSNNINDHLSLLDNQETERSLKQRSYYVPFYRNK